MNRLAFAFLAAALAVAARAGDCAGCGDAPFVDMSTGMASARISLLGARVVSFKVGGDEVLWNPRVPGEPQAKWNHGGIPVCWPWFGSSGPRGKDEPHGFAKASRFELVSLTQCRERSQAILRLRSSESTRKAWPHDFEVVYEAVLTDTLRLSLRTENTGSDAFAYTAGFHPYFRLGERDLAYVTGVDGLAFCDSRVKDVLDGTWAGVFRLNTSYDHVFDEKGASSAHSIVDPSLCRRIYVTASGVSGLVIWTPDADEATSESPGPGKLGAGDWRHFACVEPAFLWARRALVLKPGERHQFVYEISVAPHK